MNNPRPHWKQARSHVWQLAVAGTPTLEIKRSWLHLVAQWIPYEWNPDEGKWVKIGKGVHKLEDAMLMAEDRLPDLPRLALAMAVEEEEEEEDDEDDDW